MLKKQKAHYSPRGGVPPCARTLTSPKLADELIADSRQHTEHELARLNRNILVCIDCGCRECGQTPLYIVLPDDYLPDSSGVADIICPSGHTFPQTYENGQLTFTVREG